MDRETPTPTHDRPESPLDAPAYIGAELERELPRLDGVLVAVGRSLAEITGYMHGLGIERALSGILQQANNSLLDALFDLQHGRGRPALASMRNVFELLVAAHDVTSSVDLVQRYLDHHAVVAQLEASLLIESQHLPKRDRSADLHRRKKLARDTKADADAAIARYGSGFRRTWAPEDLKSRADRYGFAADYDSYRLASAVLHGSAGGSIGLRATIGRETVIRTGPALAVCPLAYLQLFRFYGALLDVVTPELGERTLEQLKRAVRAAIRYWPTYRRGVIRVDRRLWPAEPPPPLIPIFAFRQAGAHREWHLLDAARDQIIEADPPTKISAELAARLEALIKFAARTADPNELITIAVTGVRVLPKASATWRDPLEVLPRKVGPLMMKPIRLDANVESDPGP